jgi:hypothetical protein
MTKYAHKVVACISTYLIYLKYMLVQAHIGPNNGQGVDLYEKALIGLYIGNSSERWLTNNFPVFSLSIAVEQALDQVCRCGHSQYLAQSLQVGQCISFGVCRIGVGVKRVSSWTLLVENIES